MGPLPFFSAEGASALAALAARRGLYAFDFDGTLAPIVLLPDDAVAPSRTIALLERLGRVVPVAIVTGRAVADLRARLPFAARHVVGNHGAEGMPDEAAAGGDATAIEHAGIVAGWATQWPGALAAVSDDPGIFLESKGRSLSVHYRLAEDADAAEHAIHEAIGRLVPAPRLIGGKRVVNLMPEGAADKGDALVRLARHDGCDAVFYIGDDDTDEHAFVRATDAWVTVRVGRVETSAARFFVERQDDVATCIERLVEAVSPSSR